MSNDVFANGREVSCKAADGKSICAFPDVCMTPPTPPAGFLPIPYPNTGFARDTTNGSTTVKISGKEVMLKNKSYFKKSTGDEAATRSTPMGVLTHTITGKVYFTSWSMDVKIEGENVVRHFDLTTHNHASFPGNSPPWAYIDELTMQPIEACKTEAGKKQKACEDRGLKTREEQCDDDACNKAKRCLLVTKSQGDRDSASTKVGCCDDEQPHHLIEGHGLQNPGKGSGALGKFAGYEYEDAPCVCAVGDRWTEEHGALHQSVGKKETAAVRNAGKRNRSPDFAWNYEEAKEAGINAHQKVFAAGCTKACLEAQLDAYHNGVGCHNHSLLRTYDVEAAGHI